MYLTIGNIPKAIRRKPSSRACVLIAYLSVDKISRDGLSKTKLRVQNYDLFHHSMSIILQPLKVAGDPKGPGVPMASSDGAVRNVYPILAVYVADYPEQCLITCTKYGTCPKCTRRAQELQESSPGLDRRQRLTGQIIQNARSTHFSEGRKRSIHAICMDSDVAGGAFEPFWVGLPLVDIHRCITPDVLHQLYQGVFKHLIAWVLELVGEEELDRRVGSLPKVSGVRFFKNGISGLSQVSGAERKHIARILLSCLVGKIHSKGIIACRSLLHFIQLAQYPSHDMETLGYMQKELATWLENRSYFIDEKIRDDFNIPKFHSLLHYMDSICWLGTTDNYNTEMFERLHIDYAKEGWRASNKRDHFPQMIKWLSRREKITSYDFHRSWAHDLLSDEVAGEDVQDVEVTVDAEVSFPVAKKKMAGAKVDNKLIRGQIILAKHPAEPRKSLMRIVISHAAPGFLTQLKLFLASFLPPSQRGSKPQILQGTLPFTSLDVWHQYRFSPVNLFDDESDGIREVIKAVPISKKTAIPRFDTVIVLNTDEAEATAVQGM